MHLIVDMASGAGAASAPLTEGISLEASRSPMLIPEVTHPMIPVGVGGKPLSTKKAKKIVGAALGDAIARGDLEDPTETRFERSP